MKNLDTFYAELKAAGALTAEFAAAAKNDTFADFLKAHEIDGTAEDLKALVQSEMTEEQLDAVAGGANWVEAMYSICSFGFACAAAAIYSASTSGVGHGRDGGILCNG